LHLCDACEGASVPAEFGRTRRRHNIDDHRTDVVAGHGVRRPGVTQTDDQPMV
jgi:hypothetical protein